MFNKQNFCHVASNNRNEQKAGIFVYKTTDSLATITASGYFNEKLVDINLHDLIIHEQTDNADKTKVKYNILAVIERTLDNVGTTVIKRDWDTDIETAIANLRQYVDNTFVRLDGDSIMTGPLKMRATQDFKCAIAPFWDGVGFYKLNSDDSVTLIASIETPDGFVPWVTNTYNIGSSLKKWKNLYLAGTAYIPTINNGYDLAVPAKSGTLATKEEVDLAANSGRMILDQGVWYAKMYAATVAPSAENGTNYADFSQVDGQGNPIIVTYNRVNGAWVQDQTITPPAEYDGYVSITSKIWDITEQAGQQGGRILWNHQSKEFTPYPQIISFDSINITGNSTVVMPATPTDNSIPNKKYVDDAIAGSNSGYHPGLFAHEWDDHLRNDVQWLRADTFSWQDGSVYEEAYNHLADDVNAGINRVEWHTDGTINICYTRNINPQVGDSVYSNTSLTTEIGVVEATGSGITVSNNKVYHYYATHQSGTLPSETIAGVQIRYFLASDGHKICLATQESNVASIYAATGVAWYYIIDPENQRFKLPRTKFGVTGLRDTVGKYVQESLPNITGEERFAVDVGGIHNNGVASGAFYKKTNGAVYNASLAGTTATSYPLGFDASLSSSTYQNDAPVQQRATQMYLYFYVGSFTQTAIENTAGLNAELFNDKVDKGHQVVAFQEPTAENNYTWYRKYADGWVEQGGYRNGTLSGNIFSQTLPVPMANTSYVVSLLPVLGSSDTGNYYCRAIDSSTNTQIKYFVYLNGSVTTNNPVVCWEVKGMAAS